MYILLNFSSAFSYCYFFTYYRMSLKKKFEIGKFHSAISKLTTLKHLKPQIISHHLNVFSKYDAQKLKNRLTFSGVKSESMNLLPPNFDKTIGFYHPQPLFTYQKLQSFTRSTQSFNILGCYVFCNFATISRIF